MIYDRRHTRDIGDYGGIARVMPLFSAFLMLATLSSIAVPGTFGFVGEFLVLLGRSRRYPILAVIASLGRDPLRVLHALVVQRVLFNPLSNPRNRAGCRT
jgi:NADH-quinone oxidoreductase subunit M